MPQPRFIPKSFADMPATPFASAEEAWFWFARCQEVRRDGARLEAGSGDFARPCDPDDVYRAVMALARRRLLGRDHLVVLGRFGVAGRPPDARCPDERRASELWDEALTRLTTVLQGKAIVA